MGVEESRESNFETITAIHVRLMVTQTRLIAVERAGSQIEDGVGGPPTPHTHPIPSDFPSSRTPDHRGSEALLSI